MKNSSHMKTLQLFLQVMHQRIIFRKFTHKQWALLTENTAENKSLLARTFIDICNTPNTFVIFGGKVAQSLRFWG